MPRKAPSLEALTTDLVNAVVTNHVRQVRSEIRRLMVEVGPPTITDQIIKGALFGVPRAALTEHYPFPMAELTLAHIAALFDAADVLLLMIELGFDLNCMSVGGLTPLVYACAGGGLESSSLIVQSCPDSRGVADILSHATLGGADVLSVVLEDAMELPGLSAAIALAVRRRDLDCLRLLLDWRRRQDVSGCEPLLMTAVGQMSVGAVELLLDAGENPHVVTHSYETALSRACGQSGSGELVRLLLARMSGSEIDVDPAVHCRAAVHWACRTRDPALVREFVGRGIMLNRVDERLRIGPAELVGCRDEGVMIEILEILTDRRLPAPLHFRGDQAAVVLGFVESRVPPEKVIRWLLDRIDLKTLIADGRDRVPLHELMGRHVSRPVIRRIWNEVVAPRLREEQEG